MTRLFEVTRVLHDGQGHITEIECQFITFQKIKHQCRIFSAQEIIDFIETERDR